MTASIIAPACFFTNSGEKSLMISWFLVQHFSMASRPVPTAGNLFNCLMARFERNRSIRALSIRVSIQSCDKLVGRQKRVRYFTKIVVGGAVGTIVGALIGMGMPEYEAKRYEGRIKEGGILLSVHCDSSEWVKKAKELLKNTGADDIASAGEATADFLVSDKPSPRITGQGA